MRKRKIAILTYQDKYEMYDDQLRNEFENTEVIQYGSDFSYDILVKKAKMIENLGYDAIIARGYTTGLIKEHVNLPIIIVEPDMLDVLTSMIKLKPKKGEKIALLFQDNNGLLKYKDLPFYLHSIFGIDVEVFNYDDMDEYYKVVDEILMREMTIFTGYNGIMRTKQVGGKCAPLYVGENAMRDAVIEAIKIIDIRCKDADQNKKIEAILSDKNEGIINLDESLKVIWINNYAREVLKIGIDINGEDIQIADYFPDISWNSIFRSPLTNLVIKLEEEVRIIMSTKIISSSTGEKEVFLFFRQTANVVEEEKKIRAALHKKKQYAKFNLEDILGSSTVINACKEKTRQCAQFDSNVLIYGESGVGKEMFAQCIHNESSRSSEPFYAINCAALPENLLESELFGYSEGSFTGAKRGGKAGIFEMAHRGTIFLDEIGELSLASQSALLRVLQEKEIRRIGDDGVIPIDVRVIAASHKDIYNEVVEQRFRQDLFYRLNTVFLTIPPLRERKEDIVELLESFIRDCAEKYGVKYTSTFEADAYRDLLNYRWEGNIRELQNFAQRIFALGYYDKKIRAEDVEVMLSNSPGGVNFAALDGAVSESAAFLKPVTGKSGRGRITMEDIAVALQQTCGNKTEAAKLLGISRTHLWRLMNDKEY